MSPFFVIKRGSLYPRPPPPVFKRHPIHTTVFLSFRESLGQGVGGHLVGENLRCGVRYPVSDCGELPPLFVLLGRHFEAQLWRLNGHNWSVMAIPQTDLPQKADL